MGDHIDVSVPVGELYTTMFEDIVDEQNLDEDELREQLAQVLVKPTRDVIHNSYSAQGEGNE